MSFHPYLMFGGNCREAFTRYQEIFGGELNLLTMADMPPSEEGPPGASADLIMHAALTIGEDLLMASDDPTPGFTPPQGMQVNFSTHDVAESKRVFEALAEGGTMIMAIAETFWSPSFGMCVDKFGTPWMVNVVSAEPS